MPTAPADDYDLLVVGSGMAGMTAAAAVAERGGRVLVLEKAAETGGSTAISGGMIWTADDPGLLIEHCPRADPELIRGLCADLDRLVEWIRHLGVETEPEARVLGYGRGYRIDPNAYLAACHASLTAAGGHVLVRTQLYSLLVDEGAVVGVEALSAGEYLSMGSRWVLLAGGGFQADRELISAYIHPDAPLMPLRSNRASTGDGLRAAMEVGAATSPGMSGFYGHLISWPTDEWVPGMYARISQYHSDEAALVNVRGECFRPPFDGDHYNAQWTLLQPEGRAVMVMDARLRRNQTSPTSISTPVDRFAVAMEHGAHAAEAPTLSDLGDAISAWGFAGARLPEAIAAFNADASGPRRPLVEPPFYALEVRPAITFTHGGVRIDPQARVVGVDGRPIGGLLAAGGDAGGVFDGGYGGGLAAAGVYALRAADTATATR
jgi:succinate dehydrogenase/fumarate reductase flavoprotein subunit